MRASMAGRNVEWIISQQLGWPNGLTIDFDEEKLYWADAMLYVLIRQVLCAVLCAKIYEKTWGRYPSVCCVFERQRPL